MYMENLCIADLFYYFSFTILELFDTRLKTCLENTGVNRSLPPDRKNSDVHQTQQDVNTKSLTCSKAVYKNQLSVSQHRHQIVQLIQQYRVVCIEGEAGCGKSTMVPQFIVDSAEDHCKVIVCQPRRVSAIKLARHVARLRCQADDVGYCVGGNKMVRPSTRIVYCTTGYFLQVRWCYIALWEPGKYFHGQNGCKNY